MIIQVKRSTIKSCLSLTRADLDPLFLLDQGARQYITIDANRLIDQTPAIFYNELVKTLTNKTELKPTRKTLSGNDDRICYLVDPTFNIATALKRDSIDIVVSQAADSNIFRM